MQVLNLGVKIILDGGGEILESFDKTANSGAAFSIHNNYLPYYIVVRMSELWIRLWYG